MHNNQECKMAHTSEDMVMDSANCAFCDGVLLLDSNVLDTLVYMI